jgi:hypothetical protein
MNTTPEFIKSGNHSRTNLLVVLKKTQDGLELVYLSEIAKFPGPLSNIESMLRNGRAAADAQKIQDLINQLPSFPVGAPFRYFDWSSTELKSSLPISQVPIPGVIVAICEVAPLGLEAGIDLFQLRSNLQKHPNVQLFLSSPDARAIPVRAEHYDVFISYSNTDSALAIELRDQLLSRGQSVFLAEKSISVSTRWEPAIRSALQLSKIVIVLVTPNSISSDWVIFEAGAAWALDIPIAIATLFVPISALPGALSNYQSMPYETDRQREEFLININATLDACGNH